MKNNEEKLYLDNDGYQRLLEEIDLLKAKLAKNGKEKGEAYSGAVGDGWHDNFAFEESMRESRAIAKRIDDLLSKKQYLKIVDDNDKKENLVNIGDKVSINIKYSDDDIETEVITLTGNYIPNTTNEINEISLNSPLGKALFKAKIGTSTSYFVGNSEIFITILEKLNN